MHTTAGGPTDLMARELAKAAEEVTGGTFIVENRPGEVVQYKWQK